MDMLLIVVNGTHGEPRTKEDYDKFVRSFKDKLPWNVRRSFNVDDRLQKVR